MNIRQKRERALIEDRANDLLYAMSLMDNAATEVNSIIAALEDVGQCNENFDFTFDDWAIEIEEAATATDCMDIMRKVLVGIRHTAEARVDEIRNGRV